MLYRLIFSFSTIFMLVNSRTLTGKFVMKANDDDSMGGFEIYFNDVKKLDNTGNGNAGTFNGKIKINMTNLWLCDIIKFDTHRFNIIRQWNIEWHWKWQRKWKRRQWQQQWKCHFTNFQYSSWWRNFSKEAESTKDNFNYSRIRNVAHIKLEWPIVEHQKLHLYSLHFSPLIHKSKMFHYQVRKYTNKTNLVFLIIRTTSFLELKLNQIQLQFDFNIPIFLLFLSFSYSVCSFMNIKDCFHIRFPAVWYPVS